MYGVYDGCFQLDGVQLCVMLGVGQVCGVGDQFDQVCQYCGLVCWVCFVVVVCFGLGDCQVLFQCGDLGFELVLFFVDLGVFQQGVLEVLCECLVFE